MESLVGYGSDDDNETERYATRTLGAQDGAGGRRRDDDTNYDDVNMDMSEESDGAESEPELPPAEPAPRHDQRRHTDNARRSSRDHDRGSAGRRRDSSPRVRDRDRDSSPRVRDRDRDSSPRIRDRDRDSSPRVRDRNRDLSSRDRDRDLSSRDRDRDSSSRDRDRDSSSRVRDRDHDRKDRREDRPHKSERGNHDGGSSRRPLLPDRLDEQRSISDTNKMPALMELKPFGGGDPPPPVALRSQDARDAASPRFSDRRDRDKDRERERERERDRDRHSRRSNDRSSSGSHRHDRRSRSREHRDNTRPHVPPVADTAAASGSVDRRSSPSGSEFRSSSYKVNKKLEVMEKMGLQIKTPDGSMATAQQLRRAASEYQPSATGPLPSYYNPSAINANKILDQVQKRKLLWSHKAKEATEAAKWTGTRFAQDSDGKQASKFMRLMGIKEAGALPPEPAEAVDPNKKQEEMFEAMQAQYDVARATTHTMRGVGLGFQRGQF